MHSYALGRDSALVRDIAYRDPGARYRRDTRRDVDLPNDFTDWHKPSTSRWKVALAGSGFVAHNRKDGKIAWTITHDDPLYDSEGLVEAAGGWLLLAGQGYLIALDPA